MSNITIKNDESQNEKRKTTPVSESSDELEKLDSAASTALLKFWLGRRDSNPRMPVPKTGALPLGDAPIARLILTAVCLYVHSAKVFGCRLNRHILLKLV